MSMPSSTCDPNLAFVPSSVCEPNSTFVPSLTCNPSSTPVFYSILIMVSSSSYDDSEDGNPPMPAHLPPDESFELEPAPTPPLPRCVHST
jgi:hypothetical protein